MKAFRLSILNHDESIPDYYYFKNEMTIGSFVGIINTYYEDEVISQGLYNKIIGGYDSLIGNGWFQVDNYNIDITRISWSN